MPKVKKKVRKEIYPDVTVKLCVAENALTSELAQELLGWMSESNETKFYESYLFVDRTDSKIRCSNNTKNRPFDEKWALTIAQEILNRRWRLNLETIIIGKYGEVLSGQHRLIGLVLANQLWSQENHWRSKWTIPPTIEVLIAFGADESEECKRTLDNVKPRTLTDVLFTSKLFKGHNPKHRKILSKIVDYAVRLLWQRTGLANDAFAPRQTHSEALEFIEHHSKLLEMVKLIYEEDGQNSIKKYISPGYAAGLAYMMATINDDTDSYFDNKPRDERNLQFDCWNQSIAFWESFSSMANLHKAITQIVDSDESSSIYDRIACIISAWEYFYAGEKFNVSDVLPIYDVDANGFRYIKNHPSLGGIDIGVRS